jgi:hypothetical protein
VELRSSSSDDSLPTASSSSERITGRPPPPSSSCPPPQSYSSQPTIHSHLDRGQDICLTFSLIRPTRCNPSTSDCIPFVNLCSTVLYAPRHRPQFQIFCFGFFLRISWDGSMVLPTGMLRDPQSRYSLDTEGMKTE